MDIGQLDLAASVASSFEHRIGNVNYVAPRLLREEEVLMARMIPFHKCGVVLLVPTTLPLLLARLATLAALATLATMLALTTPQRMFARNFADLLPSNQLLQAFLFLPKLSPSVLHFILLDSSVVLKVLDAYVYRKRRRKVLDVFGVHLLVVPLWAIVIPRRAFFGLMLRGS